MAYRGTTIVVRPRRRRRWRSSYGRRGVNPLVLAIAVIAVAGGVLGGAVLLLSDDTTDAAAAASGSASPQPCTTLMVIPVVDLPEASEVRVNVYNSTRKPGLAAATAAELEARGYDVRKVGNDPTGARVQGVAEIRYGPAAEDGARLIAYEFPGARMILVGRTGPRVDVALGETFGAMPTTADVAAALASPSPSASGPGCPSSEASLPSGQASPGQASP